jgi:outer membrane protein assembly factor BamE
MTGRAMRTLTHTARLALLALLTLAAGCLYRMPVQQGNMLDDNQVNQLTTGMTRSQVSYLLGTPMVPPGFNNERWDYYHYFDNGRGNGRDVRQTRRLVIWFKDDKVERIENSTGEQAAAATPAAAPVGTAPPPAAPATN